MRPAILSVGTAVPDTVLQQHSVRDLFRAQPGVTPLTRRLIGAAFDASAIDTRHSVIEEFTHPSAAPVFIGPVIPATDAAPESRRILSPTTAERGAVYRHAAPALAHRAAERAIGRLPDLERSAITHLITVSCTGFFAPGIDVDLIRRLGLRPRTKRLHVGFLGCYAAFPALQQAQAITTADNDAVVLIVSVELCSLHLRASEDRDTIVSSTVFADGAAAAVVSAVPDAGSDVSGAGAERPTRPYLEISAMETALTDGAEHMSWNIGDHGYEMVLSGAVPKILESTIAEDLEPLRRARPDLVPGSWSEIDWAVHPGGRSILDRVEAALELAPHSLEHSREILRTRGNMSSATVLFILQSHLEQHSGSEPRTVCAAAFGPGLTIESALLTLQPGSPA